MKKIEIKLKECCLTCEHFDPSGCVGLSPSAFCCGEPDRVIACGHMAVCKKYLEPTSEKKMRKMDNFCEYCGKDSCELCLNFGNFTDCEWLPFLGETCGNYLRANYCRRCGRKLNDGKT